MKSQRAFAIVLSIFCLENFIYASTELPSIDDDSIVQGNLENQESSNRAPIADWTFFVMMQAKCDLHPFSIHNVQGMKSVGSNERVNIVIQWEELYKKGTWRYKIEKNNAELVYSSPNDLNVDPVRMLAEGATWTFKTYPAKHTAVIFWGHGSGAVDPAVWWNHNLRSVSWKNEEGNLQECLNELRGILFDFENKSYMNNQQMVEALSLVCKNALNGRAIDVVGFDACVMALAEVMFEIRKLARYLVGSQQVEPGLGWPYDAILTALCTKNLDPIQFAQAIVHHFEQFYKNRISWYTQSAIDLAKLDELKAAIDVIIHDLAACRQKDSATIKRVINLARAAAVQFNVPAYVDLHSFLAELDSRLKTIQAKSFSTEGSAVQFKALLAFDDDEEDDELEGCRRLASDFSRANPHLPQLPFLNNLAGSTESEQLLKDLHETILLLDSAVVANGVGSSVNRAKGISIYFPRNPYHIDNSYVKTQFAQSSSWLTFLRTLE